MNTYLTLLITSLLFFHSNLQAQFAITGAIWHYNVRDIFFPHQNSYGTCQSVSDTVINTIGCSRIVQQNMLCMESGDFVYETGGIVYRYNNSTQSFSTLYDFNAIAGGGWYVSSTLFNDSTFVTIDSVSLLNVNGQWRKILYGGTYDPARNIDFAGPFVEGIGSFTTLFPVIGVCDGGLGGLRCYEDSILGLYATYSAPTCDTVYIINEITEVEEHEDFIIYPNPTNDVFRIKSLLSHEVSSLQIFNLYGDIIYSEKVPGRNEPKVNFNFPKGIYFVQMNDREKILTRKLVVE